MNMIYANIVGSSRLKPQYMFFRIFDRMTIVGSNRFKKYMFFRIFDSPNNLGSNQSKRIMIFRIFDSPISWDLTDLN